MNKKEIKQCRKIVKSLVGEIKQLDVELVHYDIELRTKDDKDIRLANIKFILKVKNKYIYTFNISSTDTINILKKYKLISIKPDFGENVKKLLKLADVLYMINEEPYVKINQKYYPVIIKKDLSSIKINDESLLYFIDSLLSTLEIFSEYDFNVIEYLVDLYGHKPYEEVKELEYTLEEELRKTKKLFSHIDTKTLEKFKIEIEKCIEEMYDENY